MHTYIKSQKSGHTTAEFNVVWSCKYQLVLTTSFSGLTFRSLLFGTSVRPLHWVPAYKELKNGRGVIPCDSIYSILFIPSVNRQTWLKHYLPATSLAGVNNTHVSKLTSCLGWYIWIVSRQEQYSFRSLRCIYWLNESTGPGSAPDPSLHSSAPIPEYHRSPVPENTSRINENEMCENIHEEKPVYSPPSCHSLSVVHTFYFAVNHLCVCYGSSDSEWVFGYLSNRGYQSSF